MDTLVKRLFPSEQVAMMATGAGRELSKRMQADRVTEQTTLVCISTKSVGKELSTWRSDGPFSPSVSITLILFLFIRARYYTAAAREMSTPR